MFGSGEGFSNGPEEGNSGTLMIEVSMKVKSSNENFCEDNKTKIEEVCQAQVSPENSMSQCEVECQREEPGESEATSAPGDGSADSTDSTPAQGEQTDATPGSTSNETPIRIFKYTKYREVQKLIPKIDNYFGYIM